MNGGIANEVRRTVGGALLIAAADVAILLSLVGLIPLLVHHMTCLLYTSKQLVVDGRNGYDGAYGCPGYGLPDKLGLAHVVSRKPFRKLMFFCVFEVFRPRCDTG